MSKFTIGKASRRRLPKLVSVAAVFLVVIIVGLVLVARQVYQNSLLPINPSSEETVIVAIPPGTSVDEIARLLKSGNTIRSDWAFKRYVISKGIAGSLKAGTYRFKLNQDAKSIAKDLVNGKVAVELFTIFPAQRLDQIRQDFIDKGFLAASVDKALQPSNYKDHPALASKPATASLEGYLYPDSYQRTADTDVQTIIKASLDEMAKALTPEAVAAFKSEGLTTYQAITIASIVEQEIPTSAAGDRAKAAQVFLKRFRTGVQLGSDVTALYGAVKDGVSLPEDRARAVAVVISHDSLYNTYIHYGLPPGPIGNVTSDGLKAVAFPASTDYLYFVSGDDHITYFSKTLAEHQANVAAHCQLLCN